jgi:hypothetical protein
LAFPIPDAQAVASAGRVTLSFKDAVDAELVRIFLEAEQGSTPYERDKLQGGVILSNFIMPKESSGPLTM